MGDQIDRKLDDPVLQAMAVFAARDDVENLMLAPKANIETYKKWLAFFAVHSGGTRVLQYLNVVAIPDAAFQSDMLVWAAHLKKVWVLGYLRENSIAISSTHISHNNGVQYDK